MSTLIDAKGHDLQDDYLRVAEGEAIPDQGSVLVGLSQWPAAKLRGGVLGLELANTVDVLQLAKDDLDAASLITLNFPAFADGRAYSLAYRLRAVGYRGILRATGAAVMPDQLLMMRRCGFDQFRLADSAQAQSAKTTLSKAHIKPYQPDSICSYTVTRQRLP